MISPSDLTRIRTLVRSQLNVQEADVEDITMEVYESCLKANRDPHPVIVRNKCKDFLRRQYKDREFLEEYLAHFDKQPHVEEPSKHPLWELMEAAQLRPAQKQLLFLKYWKSFSNEQLRLFTGLQELHIRELLDDALNKLYIAAKRLR